MSRTSLTNFKVRIDNGAVEALNNKPKAISLRAYGTGRQRPLGSPYFTA